MFDKYKERWTKFEEDHETIRKVRIHFEENGKLYLVGAGCLGAGYLLRRPQMITIVTEAPAISPVFNNMPTFTNIVNNGGHMRKIVRCLETDELWPSVSKAAEAMSVTLSLMSNHLNGRHDHINGMHFVIEGLAAG